MGKATLQSNFRRDMTAPVLYAAIAEFGAPGVKFVKVGHTHELVARLAGIQTGCPVQIGQVAYCRFPSIEPAREAERLIHLAMRNHRSQGEWFRFDLGSAEDKRVWGGAIPAVLNYVAGKGSWDLRSIDYAEIRNAAVCSRRSKLAVIRKRKFARLKWDEANAPGV